MSVSLEDRPGSNDQQRKRPRKLRKNLGQGSVDESTMTSEMSDRPPSGSTARATFDRADNQLPDLPVDDHSYLGNDPPSFMQRSDPASEGDGEGNSMEREMRRHFNDVESSFLPDNAPAPSQHQQQQPGTLGVDDTYLELGKPGHTPPPDEMFARLSPAAQPAAREQREEDLDMEPPTPADAYKTPAPRRDDREEDEEGDEENSNLDESPSSPAAAAARRGHTRNPSSGGTTEVAPESENSLSMDSLEGEGSRTDNLDGQRPTTSSTIRPASSQMSQDGRPPQQDDITATGQRLLSSQSSHRPSFLSNRQQSQQSSRSTATMSSQWSGSDAVNSDYAQQTGGSVPNDSFESSGRQTNMLSRLPSLGSTVSYMGNSEGAPSLSRGASTTSVPSAMRSSRFNNITEEVPETPRVRGSHLEAPSDTAIAQRVQSIQVPETVARDFRARNRSLSPDKQRPSSSGGPGLSSIQGGPRRTLTLKEQNSKIDKLTKENFDLKLKIHFLDQALLSRSDDGVKELIDKNVQFQTDLANERKETQGLKRKVRELERKSKEQDEALAQAQRQQQEQQQNRSRDDASDDDDPTLQAQMHEEILYLRQQLDHSENKVTTLSEEAMTKELEKRKMADHMRSMAGNRGEDHVGMRETTEMWQDLLNAETGRREQAEVDIRKLRDELTSMRIERASPAPNKTANRRSRMSRAGSGEADLDGLSGSLEQSVAMVDQLKHENGELRRDLGAQTSMLTSRNRERERLQQEIEDLKLLQRKSDGARSVAGESIFERSISRAHQRAPSRTSDAPTQVTEAERDDWEKKEGQLRDHNAELRLKFQELERTHNSHLQYVSALEGDFQEMEQELSEASEDLRALQTERDEALQAFEEKESDYGKLEQEALTEIERLENDVENLSTQLQDAQRRLQKTQHKLEHTTDGYEGLQGELREITQSVMNLEDEKLANVRTIQNVEQQLSETEEELQEWEQKCKEIDQKNRKLEITQESLHSEITFLREEQEGDKIKIGELEGALDAAQQTIQDEQEKLRELEEGIMEERQQRDVLENKSKDEVQKVLDDLNNESQKTKDDVRKLRRNLSAKEVESTGYKSKLDELEESLRYALGDPNGTKQSLLANIERLQRELETTANSLDRAKMDLADKDRLLRHRDGLLESTSLESRRLSDLLDKERSSRKHDLDQFEKSSRGQATHMRTIAQQESKHLELETAYTQDKRRMASLEQKFRDQLQERNSLLLAMWNRLSTLCGQDWTRNNGDVDGDVPSIDVISRRLPAFSKNLILAIKTVETVIGGFKSRIKSVEKDLGKDYQTLEHNLDMRIRRMDTLERAVKDAQRAIAEDQQQQQQQQQARPQMASRSSSVRGTKANMDELNKLKSEVKTLKTELKFHREHPSPMAQQKLHQQNNTLPTGEHLTHRRQSTVSGSTSISKTSQSPARNIMANLLRHHSTSAVEQLQRPHDSLPDAQQQQQQQQAQQREPIVLQTPPAAPTDSRWVHRLKELERRLKAEREARLLDRRGARQRLEEGRLENEELRLALEHERVRREEDGYEEEGLVEGGGEEEGSPAEGRRREAESVTGNERARRGSFD